jgi:hypothetical protein
MIRCCLCRAESDHLSDHRPRMEPTDLPGSGYRCIDHDACAARVRRIVEAHAGLAEVCES